MSSAGRHFGGKAAAGGSGNSLLATSTGILKVAVQTAGQQPMLFEIDQNRGQIKNGVVLQIAEFRAPAEASVDVQQKRIPELCKELASESIQQVKSAIDALSSDCEDEDRITRFVAEDGLTILMAQCLKFSESLGSRMSSALSMLQHILLYCNRWELLSEPFIRMVALLGITPSSASISAALSVLESIIQYAGATLSGIILQNISVSSISSLLARLDDKVSALAFLNTLLSKTLPKQRSELLQEVCRSNCVSLINRNIVGQHDSPPDVETHLACFQGLYLSTLNKKLMSPFDNTDETHQGLLANFMAIVQISMNRYRPVGLASISSSASVSSVQSKDFPNVDVARMGFMKPHPSQDFADLPGGILALECLTHYARNWSEECDQHFACNLSRSAAQQCPFVRSGLALVRVLAELFSISDSTYPLQTQSYILFFASQQFFEEFFCLGMQLFNKTWREMGASTVDVDKVAGVVKKQIMVVIKADYPDWAGIKSALWEMNYGKISSVIEEEKNRVDDLTARSTPAIELSNRLQPGIVELVKKQRVNTLVKGAFFPNVKEKEKDRKKSSWYCRLHTNHMVIHWAETESTLPQPVPYSQLPNTVLVSEVRELVVGKDCPHVKSSGKKPGTWSNYAFAIIYNNEDYLGFLAEDETTFASWIDGFRILLKQPMSEESSQKDIDMILEMEMKVQLLGVENTLIPDQAPKIPPDPADLDFHYKKGLPMA